MLKGSIVVACYSRPESFEKLVKSIYGNYGIGLIEKVFLVQESKWDLNEILEKWRDRNTSIVNIPPFGDTPLTNINFNRWHSQVIAFDFMKCDWSLLVEEDIELNENSITFVNGVMGRHMAQKDFRGINLGSYESSGPLGQYSVLNQGIHGQASAIPRLTWQRIKQNVSATDLQKYAYDWLVEPIIRSGYVVVSNRSLFLDHGWSMPTHAPTDPNDPHYLKLRRSFLTSSEKLNDEEIVQNQISHTWFGTRNYAQSFTTRLFRKVRNLWNFSKFRLRVHRLSVDSIIKRVKK